MKFVPFLRLLSLSLVANLVSLASAKDIPVSIVELVYTVRYESSDEGLILNEDSTGSDSSFQFGSAPLVANRRQELTGSSDGPSDPGVQTVDWGRRRHVETSMLVRCKPSFFPANWGGAGICSYAWVRFHTEGRGTRAKRYFAIEVQHAQEFEYTINDGEEGSGVVEPSIDLNSMPGVSDSDGSGDGGFIDGSWTDYSGLPVRLIGLNATGTRVAEEFWGVDGMAVRRAPFRGAPVRWMAPQLSTTWRWLNTDWEASTLPGAEDTPVPGFVTTCINEFRVSSTQTRRHAGKELGAVVESIREDLLGRGWMEVDSDLPEPDGPGDTLIDPTN